MLIAINKAHFPVTVLGPGRRIGIWLQGCSIGCPGCVSRDTWATDAGRNMPLAQLLAWCRDVSGGQLDGVTLSGGEPFDQPLALAALLDGLAQWRTGAGLDFDLLCYSGYPQARLAERHPHILAKLDALIPEPYVDNLPLARLWRGSANQTLVPLSERGRRVYAPYLDAAADTLSKRMQLAVDGRRLWFAGIPARGDMERLEALCKARGLQLDDKSWGRA
ncbi:MAG: 4Fe-4S cluster-binding domain-containing protein [Rhodocyclaceae bacterium]|nr:4Fe-4S cluster-binding domain-containing protein [Rhodocyclaceae bacterium]